MPSCRSTAAGSPVSAAAVGPSSEHRIEAQGAGNRVAIGQLQVARVLHDFILLEALPLTGVAAQRFWPEFERLIDALAPRNAQLLQRRDQLQSQIDAWHQAHPGPAFDRQDYRRFLEEIGYLVPGGEAFQIETRDVDAEIAHIGRTAAGGAGQTTPATR